MENANCVQCPALVAIWEAQTIEVEMVQNLHFPLIDDRYQAIPEAHRQTFRWIFDESPKEDCLWSNFADWLRTGNGLYWINGKAGSGKSTLMRYIYNNIKTRQHLRFWAGKSSLDISGFFFWNSGSPIQRSQTGLLKSLLFQALQRRPNLVRLVFPKE
jgi:predicted ATPase